MDYDILLQIFRYFCRFVPAEVLRKMAVTPDYAAMPGFNELITELSDKDPSAGMQQIDTFVFSANPDYVADRVRNSSGTVLFVEYGDAITGSNGMSVGVNLAVTIAKPYNKGNNDNLSELIVANDMFNIVMHILSDMQAYNDGCHCETFLSPANISPVNPVSFYDRIGFTIFVQAQGFAIKHTGSFNQSYNKSFY